MVYYLHTSTCPTHKLYVVLVWLYIVYWKCLIREARLDNFGCWKWGLGPECVVMIIHFFLGGGPSTPVSLLFRFLIYWQYTLSKANLIPSLLMKVIMAGSKVPGTCCKNMSWFVECGVFCHMTIIIEFCFRYISSRIKHSCLHLFSRKTFFWKGKNEVCPLTKYWK